MARPTKIDDGRITRITQALSLGACYEHACKFAGISSHTLRNWLSLGQEQQHGHYRELYDRVQEAEGRAVVGWLAKIEKAANEGTWQAAAWKLERRYPREYGRHVLERPERPELVVAPEDGAPVPALPVAASYVAAPAERSPLVAGRDHQDHP